MLTDNRVKYFAHPDLDEFKKDFLVPHFHKVVTEKPKESRSGMYYLHYTHLRYTSRTFLPFLCPALSCSVRVWSRILLMASRIQ